jgi:CheY-like chemotaxis protein
MLSQANAPAGAGAGRPRNLFRGPPDGIRIGGLLRQLETMGGRVVVALSDVVMPVMGGVELAKRLTARPP